MPDDPDPSSRSSHPDYYKEMDSSDAPAPPTLLGWLKGLLKTKPDTTLREAIEEYIEEPESFEDIPTISAQERAIFANILALRELKVVDVMVPRADIVAIDVSTTRQELLSLLAEKQFSRIPVYRDTLDEVVGTIHLKDVMAALAQNQDIDVPALLNQVPIVSPSLPLLDLVLEMQQSRRHMVLVIDEYGGIDGLVTIGDIIESIIGEIDDEHDTDEDPEITEGKNGDFIVDGRVDITEFENRFGQILSDEEREDSDTLGGLVSAIAGRVPARGEILKHETGMEFEILEADPRYVSRLKISKIPASGG